MKAKILSALNKILFFSKRKHCPICESNFFCFNPLPPEYEKNWERYGFPWIAGDFETLNAAEFSCPECGCTDRDRIYATYLVKQKNSNAPISRILDIAPSAALSRWIKNYFNVVYHTADLFMEGVDYKVNVENMDIFEADNFDLIICSHVLEHVPNDQVAMSELFRVLKPGGQAIMMVPIVKSLDTVIEDPKETNVAERWRKFGQDDHIRLYNSSGFVTRLNKAGFKVKTFSAGAILPNCRTIGVNPSSVLYIAGK